VHDPTERRHGTQQASLSLGLAWWFSRYSPNTRSTKPSRKLHAEIVSDSGHGRTRGTVIYRIPAKVSSSGGQIRRISGGLPATDRLSSAILPQSGLPQPQYVPEDRRGKTGKLFAEHFNRSNP